MSRRRERSARTATAGTTGFHLPGSRSRSAAAQVSGSGGRAAHECRRYILGRSSDQQLTRNEAKQKKRNIWFEVGSGLLTPAIHALVRIAGQSLTSIAPLHTRCAHHCLSLDELGELADRRSQQRATWRPWTASRPSYCWPYSSMLVPEPAPLRHAALVCRGWPRRGPLSVRSLAAACSSASSEWKEKVRRTRGACLRGSGSHLRPEEDTAGPLLSPVSSSLLIVIRRRSSPTIAPCTASFLGSGHLLALAPFQESSSALTLQGSPRRHSRSPRSKREDQQVALVCERGRHQSSCLLSLLELLLTYQRY